MQLVKYSHPEIQYGMLIDRGGVTIALTDTSIAGCSSISGLSEILLLQYSYGVLRAKSRN